MLRSSPTENARPSPVMTTHLTSGDFSPSFRASSRSFPICSSKAFSLSGLFRVIHWTPFLASALTVWCSIYFPLNSGLLFSMNAFIPSSLSSDAKRR